MPEATNSNISIEVLELIRQAETIVTTGKYEDALHKLECAENIDKKVVKIYLDRAIIYIIMGKIEDALKEIEKAKIIDNTDGSIYFHEGNIAYTKQDLNKAKACYSKAIELGFVNNNIYYHIANCLADQGEKDAAIYYYSKAEQMNPYDGKSIVRKIQLLIRSGEYQKALVSARKLQEIKPEAFEGYHYKFVCNLALNRAEEAKKILEQGIDMFKDDLGFKYDLMMYYDHEKQFNEAVEIIDKYFLSANDDGKWNHLITDKANLLFKAKRFDEAEAVALAILKTKHDDTMAYYVMFKKMTEADYDSAIYYALEIKKNKENTEDLNPYYAALYYEALSYLKKENKEKAEALFRDASIQFRAQCVKEPGNVNLYVYRCVSYKALKEYDKALDAANYIITLTNGEFIEGYMLRSLIYTDMNQPEKAEADKKIVEAANRPILNLIV